MPSKTSGLKVVLFDVLLAIPISQRHWSCSPSEGLLQVNSEVPVSSFKPVVFDGVRAVADKCAIPAVTAHFSSVLDTGLPAHTRSATTGATI
jgi:hypothetical protein